jgi:tetratricopeptide (TPR) repeat protein
MRARWWVVLGALLTATIVCVYAPVAHHHFINYDDPTYVTENPAVQHGFTRAALWWGLTVFHGANWHPLTWWSHTLDVWLLGPDAGRHLLESVALHAVNALVLCWALARLTGDPWPSAVVAALFALHPLQVESVAWVSERKSTLSTLCWFLTLGLYRGYVDRPTAWRWAALFAGTVAGLAAKPMVVTLPFTLLLLDVWPLGRWTAGGWRRCVLEKLPLLAASAGASVLTWMAQHAHGAVATLGEVPLTARLANATLAYAIIPWKLVAPSGLCIMHPVPRSIPGPAVAGAGAALLLVSAAVWAQRAKRPYLLVGWLWYVGTLFPVCGLMAQGEQLWADRFAYVPMVGLLVAGVWAARDLVGRVRGGPAASVAGLVVLCVVLAVLTRRQVAFWSDTTTVFTHALAVHPDNHVAFRALGKELAARHRYDEALTHFDAGLALAPWDRQLRDGLASTHVTLGVAAEREGRTADAEAHYRAAIAVDPTNAIAHNDLGLLLLRSQGVDAALPDLTAAVAADPRYAKARATLGHALLANGRPAEALPQLDEAVALDPGLAPAALERATALAALGEIDRARAAYEALLGWAPAPEREEAARRLAELPAPPLR